MGHDMLFITSAPASIFLFAESVEGSRYIIVKHESKGMLAETGVIAIYTGRV